MLDSSERDLDDEQHIRKMCSLLPPTKISSDGRVMEWQEEYDEAEKGHRHISHMYGLHPGNEITDDNPELFAAAEKTIDTRLSAGGGTHRLEQGLDCMFLCKTQKRREGI